VPIKSLYTNSAGLPTFLSKHIKALKRGKHFSLFSCCVSTSSLFPSPPMGERAGKGEIRGMEKRMAALVKAGIHAGTKVGCD
jgi:hypothetical protein